MYDLRSCRALVTGASSGIGREIARELAAHGAHLVLAARRRERLEELGAALGRSHAVRVDVVEVDLSAPEGPAHLIAAVQELHGPDAIDVLVNNAGTGLFGDGVGHGQHEEAAMLRLNVLAVAELTKHYAAEMRRRGAGRILQVASTAAFQPCPGYAAYAASKAFVLHHAEALAEELRDSGVTITALCPGSTNTEFFEVSGHERNSLQRSTSLEPDEVARQAVRCMRRGGRVVVPGWTNKLGAATVGLLPRRLRVILARKVLE